MATVFLHIGKTGGTALRRALKAAADSHDLRLVGHRPTLMDTAPPDKVVFAVREPISRFVSGFNTRLRRGYPRRTANDWEREDERRAFARFTSANALGEALSDPELGEAAREAMGAIGHVRRKLAWWLKSPTYLEERAADVLMVCLTPELDADFGRLKRILGLPDSCALPSDEIGTHRTPDGFDRGLSSLAVQNLTDWYAEDFPIFRACLELRERLVLQADRAAP